MAGKSYPTERNFPEGLSFQDVLLLPCESDILPKEVSLTARLTTNISLNIPLVSAAMDTVTEASLAIRMAQEGGLGVIHRNLDPSEQAQEVRKVKKSESGMITDPITIEPDAPVHRAIGLMHRHGISGIPVVKGKRLVGILTNRDLQFEKDLTQKVSDVMTADNLVTTREGVSLEQAQEVLHRHRIEKLLVVNESNELKGLITIRDIKKALEFPNACKDEQGRLKVGAAVGTGKEQMARVEALINADVDLLVVDTAHGHSKLVSTLIHDIKAAYPDVEILAGNVATAEGAAALVKAGVSGIKAGIGPGSICTTRIVAGVGVPQLTAIMEAVDGVKGKDIPVVADGGIRFSGDIVKALAAGAGAVMIGNLFAGTDEAPGEQILYQGRAYKTYRGMGSISAMRSGSADRYFQDEIQQAYKLVPEGVEGRVPYKGSLSSQIHQLLGGLRSGMGYVGAKDLNALQERAKFVKITSGGLRESHVHDVSVTKEAPNYRID